MNSTESVEGWKVGYMEWLPFELFLLVCENLYLTGQRSLVCLGAVSREFLAGVVDVLRRLARRLVSDGTELSPMLASWFWHHPDGR